MKPDDVIKPHKAREGRASSESIDAFYAAARIAIKAVLSAAAAGNVQCQQAQREMQPHLDKLTNK